VNTVALAMATILAALSILHVFWGVRGGSTSSGFVPEADGEPLFRPRPVDCFAVAAALALAAFLVLSVRGIVASPLPFLWTRVGATGVGAAFLLRSIGEFRYVGFFKRVRDTRFGRLDTLVFSPLCLLLGVAGLAVALL
jgi:hypothetical protein